MSTRSYTRTTLSGRVVRIIMRIMRGADSDSLTFAANRAKAKGARKFESIVMARVATCTVPPDTSMHGHMDI
eukprot:COSAG05_NODE_201_length_14387_cov_59.959476_6_plen_72_part_00